MHRHNIGVIIDWSPAHFATDSFGLTNYDGTPLYENSGLAYYTSIQNLFFSYGVEHANFNSEFIREFYTSNAIAWVKDLHLDGIRFDCVKGLLYADDQENIELFLKNFNCAVKKEAPGAFTIAEDYSGDSRVTKSVEGSGFGFDFIWNNGTTHALIDYLSDNKRSRKQLISALKSYSKSQNINYFSHDEFRQKGSFWKNLEHLLDEGLSEAAQVDFMHSIYSLIMFFPGKKTFFMGHETLASRSLDELIANDEAHFNSENEWLSKKSRKTKKLFQRAAEIYSKMPAMHEKDSNFQDMQLIDVNNDNVLAFERSSSKGPKAIVIHSSSSNAEQEIYIPASDLKDPKIIFQSTDIASAIYPVYMKKDKSKIRGYYLTVPRFTTIVIEEGS